MDALPDRLPMAMNVEREGAAMSEPSIRERLVGCWPLAGYDVTAAEGDATDRPLVDNPLGTILYTPDGYMSAQLARPGPSAVDD
jgi:lipocalin-like protein